MFSICSICGIPAATIMEGNMDLCDNCHHDYEMMNEEDYETCHGNCEICVDKDGCLFDKESV